MSTELHPERRRVDADSMQRSPIEMFREYADIERRRSSSGVTALEYQRWLDLRARLAKLRTDGSRGAPADVPATAAGDEPCSATRLLVEFTTPECLRRAWMHNVLGDGVFIDTPFAADVGTEFELVIAVKDVEQPFLIPASVVSNNVADGFSTEQLGMGVRFHLGGAKAREAFGELRAVVRAAVGGSSPDRQ